MPSDGEILIYIQWLTPLISRRHCLALDQRAASILIPIGRGDISRELNKREKMLEILFVVFTIVFAATGYSLHQWGRLSYQLTKRNPNELRIVTWNVGGADGHGGRPLDNQFLPHVATVLKELDADLILLQEIAYEKQVDRLSRLLNGKWEAMVSNGGCRSVAILGQRGGLYSQTHPEKPHNGLAASYRSPGKPPVFLMNIHADPYSALQRNRLIGRATDVLMSRFREYLKILAGDLNLDIDIDKRRDLFTDDEYLDVETYLKNIRRIP